MQLVQLMQPERLAWLLLLPLLYWLSLPPRPKRARLTAHLRLWRRAQESLGRKPSQQRRLRFLLLVLAFLAAVLAHARPRLRGSQGAEELVILVDCSASLAARARPPGEQDAWTELRHELETGLHRVPEHIPLRLGLCGSELRVLRGSRQELLTALPQEPRGAGGVDLAELALSLQSPGTAVWTLTDGLGTGQLPEAGALSLVGLARENVALTALELEDRWPLPDVFLRARLQNFGSQPVPLRLHLEGAVEPVADQPLELGPGEARNVELSLRRLAGGLLRLQLLPGAGATDEDLDALAVDDEVRVLLPPAPAPDIAVLEEATGAEDSGPGLEAIARALAAETGGRVLPREQMQRAGFLLVEGGVLPAAAAGMRLISFGTRFGARPLQPGDLVLDPKLEDWERGHTLTVGLDFSELVLAQCLRQDFGSGEIILLRAEHGALVLLAEDAAGPRSVHLAFRLADSNLAQLPAFPQFLRRCFAWTHGERARARLAPGNLLSAAESDLRRVAEGRQERALPAFGEASSGLAVPLLLLGLMAMAARVYV